MSFGLYHTILTIEGMPELKYRLLVMVEKPFPGKAGSQKQKQTPKRMSGKKIKTAAKRKKQPAMK